MAARRETVFGPASNYFLIQGQEVIYDQYHRGPLSTETIAALILLQADNINLLGLRMVSWGVGARQETAYALRLLEMMGRAEIPVYRAAKSAMLNTQG